jgi:hypothetical protein
MLIKRDVFEKLDGHPATKPFKNDIGLDPALDPYMKTYFDTAVREGRYYSEDWTFCENWRDIGGQVWVDKRVLLRHTGTYTFAHETQEQLRKDFAAMGPIINTQPQQPMHDVPAEVLAAEPVAEVVATNKKSKKAD